MDTEFKTFLIDQFSKVATKEDLKEFATKTDFHGLQKDLADFEKRMIIELDKKADKTDLLNLATKSELAEVRSAVEEIKDTVNRLDRRTDEGIRATMKDVDRIKVHLAKQGHKI